MSATTTVCEAFRESIKLAQLTPPEEIIADGQIQRFASNGEQDDDAGWYVLHLDDIPAGKFGCFRAKVEQTWCAKSDKEMTGAERDRQRQRFDEARRQRDQAARLRHAAAAKRAQTIYDQAGPAPAAHPYLVRKQIHPHGLRLVGDSLVVPVMLDGTLASLQFIDKDGGKEFLAGGAVKGGSFTIGDLTDATTFLMGEGFPTCASLHEGTGLPVVCTFGAGNLKSVAMRQRAQHPTAKIVIAADNDVRHDGTSNTGVEAATEAAKAINGLVAVPELNGLKCDFNDLHQAKGLDAVREVIDAALKVDEPPAFHPTDVGNGQLFAQQHREQVRYCFGLKQWLVWDGQRWKPDTDGGVMMVAKRTARSLYGLAEREPDDVRRKALVRWAAESETERRLKSMLSLAQSEPGIAIEAERLDADPLLLNVANGTLDLRTGTLRPAQRADFITKLVPVDYRPDAVCPEFERLLHRLFDHVPAVRHYLQRVFGYSLTGLTSEQCFFIFHGIGANGKSTILRAILDLLGDYATTTRPETFLTKRGDGIPNDVAALAGARFVVSLESEHGKRLAEALVKGITGGDKLSARFLHKEFFTFAPQLKFFIGTNHKPTIRGTDHAMWRRVRCIPFAVVIPDHEQDKMLSAKLREEYEGVLTWLVQGCMAWRRDGLGPPLEVLQATAAYRAEQDVFGAFLRDCCVLEPTAKSTKDEVYNAYSSWCETNGEPYRLTKRELTTALCEAGIVNAKVRKARGWLGLRLRTPLDAESDDEPVAVEPEVVVDAN